MTDSDHGTGTAVASAVPTPVLSNEDDVVAIPLRRPWRWISAFVVALLAASFVIVVATNPNLDFDTVGEFLFDPRILEGVWLTILITVISMV